MRLAPDALLDALELALIVRSDRKRRGIGLALIRHALCTAAAQGVYKLTAQSSPRNAPFIALAGRFDFVTSWDPIERVVRFERPIGA